MLNNVPDILSLKDLTKTLQIGRNSALYLVQNNIIPACKIMGKWRITKEDLIETFSFIKKGIRHFSMPWIPFSPILTSFLFIFGYYLFTHFSASSLET